MPDEERFPSCARDDVGVGVPGGLIRSRFPGRVGVDGTGEGVLAKRSKDGVEGEEGKRGSGRDFLWRDEDDGGELAFPTEARFGVRGAGELIVTRLGDAAEVGDAGDWEGDAWEERWRVGEDIEASLSEGVTKLVNPGKRNRC